MRASSSGLKRGLAYQALLKRKNPDKLRGFFRPVKRRTTRDLTPSMVDYSHR